MYFETMFEQVEYLLTPVETRVSNTDLETQVQGLMTATVATQRVVSELQSKVGLHHALFAEEQDGRINEG